MKTTQYLRLKEVLDLHDRTLLKHGGGLGVRDLGLIESALHRPQSGYYASLSLQAAALLQSFCMNHAFIDGNKRVALLVTVVFLKMNGYHLSASSANFVRFIIDEVIIKKADIDSIATWLESQMKKD